MYGVWLEISHTLFFYFYAMEDNSIRYIAYAIEKVQKRDAFGRFLKKEIRYISKNCPKVILCKYICDAKKYTSRSKALYAIGGACPRQKNKYDFYVTKVKIKYEIEK